MKTAPPHVEDGTPVPNVSKRQMKTLASIADDAMELLPHRALDLADEVTRDKMRQLLEHIIGIAAHHIEWAYRRATDAALKQSSGLMRDPNRYLNQKTRSAKRRAERKRRDEERLADIAKRQRWNKEAGVADDEPSTEERLN